MNQIYAIYVNGQRCGVTVAPDAQTALSRAQSALTRRTASQEDSCPAGDVHVEPAQVPAPTAPVANSRSALQRLLDRLAVAANSRFIETVC